MTLTLILFFIIIGLLFLIVEILVTPGIVLGVIGLGLIAFGVFRTYEEYGTTIGNWTLFGVGIFTVGAVLFALKTGVWSRMASTDSISSKAKEDAESIVKIGDVGKALSALRPLGTGLFNGKKVEISSEGEAIEVGTSVEITRITQNKIFIKKV